MHGTSYVGERVTDAVKATDVWRLCGYYREEMHLIEQRLLASRREVERLQVELDRLRRCLGASSPDDDFRSRSGGSNGTGQDANQERELVQVGSALSAEPIG
jgi:hypothetical protein